MFSKPQPADLIIGWFPVCFPSLADTGQKHLLTKRGHRAVESGPSHFCIPSSIPPSMLDWLVLMASWENGGFSFFSQTMSLLEVASKDNCGKSNLLLDLRKTDPDIKLILKEWGDDSPDAFEGQNNYRACI